MPTERFTNYNPIAKPSEPVEVLYDRKSQRVAALPQSTLASDSALRPNIPEIYSLPKPSSDAPRLWKRESDVEKKPKVVYAAKADVGGSGGHVEVDPEVERTFLDSILRYNRYGKRGTQPIFRSLIVDHTGDDVAVVAVADQDLVDRNLKLMDELVWDAFWQAGDKALELGDYGAHQDLKVDAFTGNLHGLGPARVMLPLPLHEKNPSQSVLVATGDKTEPGLFAHMALGAYYDPSFNTGLLVADSAMNKGYIFEIVDLDTKTLAHEQGIPANDQKALDKRMRELGEDERFMVLNDPEDHYEIYRRVMETSRNVVARIWSKDQNGNRKQLGFILSAERLHNIASEGEEHNYGGKDDPIALALCQGDWPAPGELVAKFATTPLVAGDCRGSHWLHLFPAAINSQTSYWSGPIISALTLSINTHSGIIGSISDQMARNTPWDRFRFDASGKMLEHRVAHGALQPGILPVSEIEYHKYFRRNKEESESRWQTRKPV